MTYELPQLPYAYDALEPYIDTLTMQIHHTKHHQAYVDNLNKALTPELAAIPSLEELLANVSQFPPAIRNNGGGHYNHSLFWTILSASPQTEPQGNLRGQIEQHWGSVEAFKKAFTQGAMAQFGSGWAWLLVQPDGQLALLATPNQDNPLMDIEGMNRGVPIMGLDVWEHAYYLKHQNRRAEYVDAFWSVLDWARVDERFVAAHRQLLVIAS